MVSSWQNQGHNKMLDLHRSYFSLLPAAASSYWYDLTIHTNRQSGRSGKWMRKWNTECLAVCASVVVCAHVCMRTKREFRPFDEAIDHIAPTRSCTTYVVVSRHSIPRLVNNQSDSCHRSTMHYPGQKKNETADNHDVERTQFKMLDHKRGAKIAFSGCTCALGAWSFQWLYMCVGCLIVPVAVHVRWALDRSSGCTCALGAWSFQWLYMCVGCLIVRVRYHTIAQCPINIMTLGCFDLFGQGSMCLFHTNPSTADKSHFISFVSQNQPQPEEPTFCRRLLLLERKKSCASKFLHFFFK